MGTRFFVPPDQLQQQRFTLLGTEARHAAIVLRKKPGDIIGLFDGQDLSYLGRIDSISADRVEGRIVSEKPAPKGTRRELILCQALIKGPKWDWLVEKASEIGATRLVPLLTTRTIVKPVRDQGLERSKRIALAAAKQCGRNSVMEVSSPTTLSEILEALPQDGVKIMPWEKEGAVTMRQAMKPSGPVTLFIGPEGGWEAHEVELARRHHVVTVSLGENLLRSETAGLVALTLAIAEMGQ